MQGRDMCRSGQVEKLLPDSILNIRMAVLCRLNLVHLSYTFPRRSVQADEISKTSEIN